MSTERQETYNHKHKKEHQKNGQHKTPNPRGGGGGKKATQGIGEHVVKKIFEKKLKKRSCKKTPKKKKTPQNPLRIFQRKTLPEGGEG